MIRKLQINSARSTVIFQLSILSVGIYVDVLREGSVAQLVECKKSMQFAALRRLQLRDFPAFPYSGEYPHECNGDFSILSAQSELMDYSLTQLIVCNVRSNTQHIILFHRCAMIIPPPPHKKPSSSAFSRPKRVQNASSSAFLDIDHFVTMNNFTKATCFVKYKLLQKSYF